MSNDRDDLMLEPVDIMQENAEVYRSKNEDYGSSWWDIGEVLWIMADREPITLESPADIVRLGLHTRRLDKAFRAFNGEFCVDELDFESVEDSHSDESVYAAMAAAVSRFEREGKITSDNTDLTDPKPNILPEFENLIDLPRVYLAGAVENAEDNGEGWRERIEHQYADDIEPVNPLDKYNVPAGDVDIVTKDDPRYGRHDNCVTSAEIVEGDLELIDSCDALLAYWTDVPMTGTPMEIRYAYANGIPVFVVYDTDAFGSKEDLSPWLRYHADGISSSFRGAIDGILHVTGGDES